MSTTEIPETPYVETEALLAVMNEDEDVADILSEMNPSEVHALGQAANRLYPTVSKDLAPELRGALEADPSALQLYHSSAQYRMTVELWSHLLVAIREEMHAEGIAPEVASGVIRNAVTREMAEQGEAAARAEAARRFALESEVRWFTPNGGVNQGRL